MKRVGLSIGLVIMAGTSLPIAAAQTTGPRGDMEFVFAGMRKERMELKSGVYRVHGHYSVKGLRNRANELDGPLEIFGAFDTAGKRVRFDRSMPGWIPDRANARADPKNPERPIVPAKKGIFAVKYYNNGKRTGCWFVAAQMIGVSAAVQEPPQHALGWFDIRGLGLYHPIAAGRCYDLEKLFKEYTDLKDPPEVNKTNPSIWEIVWSLTDELSVTQWHVSVDVERGFTPVRFVCREHYFRNPPDAWTVYQNVHVKWEEHAGVWIPVHYQENLWPSKDGHLKATSFDIDWESVNEPLRAELFDYKDFDAPPSVEVVDDSLGQPVALWSQYFPSVFGKKKTSFVKIAVPLLLAIALGAGGWFWWRRRRAWAMGR